jgi:hypothetical protein
VLGRMSGTSRMTQSCTVQVLLYSTRSGSPQLYLQTCISLQQHKEF